MPEKRKAKKQPAKKWSKETDQPNPPPPPALMHVDMTRQVYEQLKRHYIEIQHPVVRPHIREFFAWLKNLKATDVYDAIENGETAMTKYKEIGLHPMRITIAAGRGVLKASKALRRKADQAINIEISRTIIRFDNPKVWKILQEYDKDEKWLQENIQDVKQILGLEEV